MSTHDYVAKLVLVGDAGVGKSCLLMRYIENRFTATHDLTIGVEFGATFVTVRGVRLKLHVWDTAGQEGFRSIVRSYYRGAAGVVLVYDVTRRKTFEHVLDWLKEVRHGSGTNNHVVMLVANKTELPFHQHQVTASEGAALAALHGLQFATASAKTGQGVQELFERHADELVLCIEDGRANAMAGLTAAAVPPATIDLDEGRRMKKCCPG